MTSSFPYLGHLVNIIAYLGVQLKGFTPSRVDFPDFAGRFGSGESEIVDAVLLDEAGQPVDVVYTKKSYIFRVSILFHQNANNPIVGFILNSSSNMRLYNTHTFLRGKKLGYFKQGQYIEVSLKFRANMLRGMYSLTPAISYADGANFFDYRNRLITFRVIDDGNSEGVINLDAIIGIKRGDDYYEI